jgi:hypothetical protein
MKKETGDASDPIPFAPKHADLCVREQAALLNARNQHKQLLHHHC